MNIIIYHNNRCGNSRKCLQILQDQGVIPQIREYLKVPLNRKELESILEQLKIDPMDLIRTKEEVYKEHYRGLKLNRAAVIDALLEHPELMQRPVVSDGKSAVIARPPDKVLDFLLDINHQP